ncbi:uncharacterized protein PV09_01565 [Verruconis gallopava]|uniref:Uncharacterized protein n=1 Tax=Verruconis gallopava TaxID=253628 RepID=A0A0D2AMC3_9PEZI|nr:uncharacterized protein PV09_01565 [Verruconis gallopava]KIW07615.1 hypothetical protein PV09_01565 [Verruconis gallopava]
MADSSTTPADTPVPTVNGGGLDVEMKDEAGQEPHPSTIPSAPVNQTTSRPHTPAARGSPHPAPPVTVPPSQPNPHGSPVRVYLNQKVTPYLLEGMKQLAIEEPEKPLKWLAEYLERKSREVEG